MKNEDEMHDLEKKIRIEYPKPIYQGSESAVSCFYYFVSNFFLSVLSMIIIIMDSYQSPLRPCCICLVLSFEKPSSLSLSLAV